MGFTVLAIASALRGQLFTWSKVKKINLFVGHHENDIFSVRQCRALLARTGDYGRRIDAADQFTISVPFSHWQPVGVHDPVDE